MSIFGNLVLYGFFNCPEMMPSRKDNLYIIRMRGTMSSVKPRWWESSDFLFVLYMVCAAALLAQGNQGTMKYLLTEMLYKYAFKC